jgi:hypothetical protein
MKYYFLKVQQIPAKNIAAYQINIDAKGKS